MSDLSSMNRETKKRQLKRRVIDPRATTPPGRGSGHEEENEEEVVRRVEKKVRRRRLRIILFLILAILLLGFLGYRYVREYQYTGYEVTWERELATAEGSFVRYEKFGDNVLRYTKDGASYLDASGKPVWSQAYELNTPICYVNGNAAVVADQMGNTIYIFDKNGCQGVATTLLPIIKVSCSGFGETAALLEDNNATYINYFKKDGSILDWSIKTILSGDGFITDLTVSPEGTQLMVADTFLENGTMKNQVVFYNFSEFGKTYPHRMVGAYKEPFENSLIGRVRFFTEKHAFAVANDGLVFFSMENVTSPTALNTIKVDKEIRSIFYSDQYLGLILSDVNGDNDYRMDVYKSDGTLMFSHPFQYQYRDVDIDGDRVILYNENSCKVFNMSGVEKFSADFDFPISKVSGGKYPNTLMIMGTTVMKEIKLK